MGTLLQPTGLFFLLAISLVLLVIFVAGFAFLYKAHGEDLRVRQEMQTRQIEHQRRMKEMEIEKARIELESARLRQSA
ncbi:MAG TPA: hypothetical protein VFD30_03245 [Terriglobia bacterium]|jgi:hypothetical protein|nr:hypothetical protein [Terriglobia bacterium]